MNTIRDYIESLFLNIPESGKKTQLKTDLLANMEDRYDELIEEGKGEHEAIGITITEFGSLDELLEELGMVQSEEPDTAPEPEEAYDWGEMIDEDKMLEYLAKYRKAAVGISLGVLLCITGVGVVPFLSGFRERLSLLIMFTMIAIAVGCFIMQGMSLSHIGKMLNDRPISGSASELAARLKEEFHRSFVLCMVLGVGLCVMSVGMVIFGSMTIGEGFGIFLMFGMVAFGVFLLIYGGMVNSSFAKFTNGRIFVADEDEMGPRAYQEKYGDSALALRTFDSFYWPAVVACYLVWSFIFHAWGISWIIFPLAGVFHGGVKAFVDARNR